MIDVGEGVFLEQEASRKLLSRWLKRLSDFKMTQPKKKRQNINKALWKIRNDKQMNKLEKEAIENFVLYCVNIDTQVSQ